MVRNEPANAIIILRCCAAALLSLGACAATLGDFGALAAEPEPAPVAAPATPAISPPMADPKAPSESPSPTVREIFVPLADLHVILSADVHRVFVTREEYDALAAEARLASQPEDSQQPAALLSGDYEATIEDNHARLVGTFVAAAPHKDLSAVELNLSGVALRSALLDDKPASLGRNPAGRPVLFVGGAGRHVLKLDILAPVETAAAQRIVTFEIPTPPATRLRLSVPGEVDLKTGVAVIGRTVDEQRQVTRFELLPRSGPNSLVLSLNHRQLQKDRVVVAHAVLADEITTAYERLHVTMSLTPLHGAADEFRFSVPDGFEVTGVAAPQVARWNVTSEGGNRILVVRLHEPATDTVSLRITAIRTGASYERWQLPRLTALDVVGQATLVGLLLENRLKLSDVRPTNLIAVDAAVLAEAIPAEALASRPGAPEIVPAAAFYAPLRDFSLAAGFVAPPPELRVTTNLLLTLEEKAPRFRGGFALVGGAGKLLGFDFTAPAGWQVSEIATAAGAAIPLEAYPAADGASRIRVRLPQAVPQGESQTVYFRAVGTDEGWLGDWQTRGMTFPEFRAIGATRDIGAIAVVATDDMQVRADKADRLTPLDANEKSKYGLEDVPTDLAYRYDSPPFGLSLAVTRVAPRVTARVFSFFNVQTDLLLAHYEIAYDVREARVNRLAFSLPVTTPAELQVRGLDGVTLKESSSVLAGPDRQWTVLLGEPRRGAIRLAIDFQQPLKPAEPPGNQPPAAEKAPAAAMPATALPLIRARDVAYQSGAVSVEGAADEDVRVTTALRKVDVGELAEADYQPGRRLLGAFGYGGDQAEVKVSVDRPAGYELPTAIVERAELLTAVSAHGVSQTAARFRLRAKSMLIEARLPPGSTLWSAYLDGQPTLPQRAGAALLIGLPASAALRASDLQLVYETQIGALGPLSRLHLEAPQLWLHSEGGASAGELPLADLVWRLSAPDGLRIVNSSGTVFSDEIGLRRSPLSAVAIAIGEVLTPLDAARSTSLEMQTSPKIILSEEAEDLLHGVNAQGQSARNSWAREDMDIGDTIASVDARYKDGAAATSQQLPNSHYLTDDVQYFAKSPDGGGRDGRDKAVAPPAPAAEPMPAAGQPMPEMNAPAAADGPTAVPGFASPAKAKESAWAVEGIRSLPIELQAGGPPITFQSLGEAPRLAVTLIDRERFDLLAWAVGALAFVVGVWLLWQPRGVRTRYLAALLVVSLAAPLAVPYGELIAPECDMAFFAGCWLALLYALAAALRAVMKRLSRASHAHRATIAAMLVLGLCAMSAADEPADDARPLPPVKVPADAIIVPYDPATEDPLKGLKPAPQDKSLPAVDDHVAGAGKKILVPYDKYLDLQRAANPDKKPAKPPADFALAGAEFVARLIDGESLLIEGHLNVDVLVDHYVRVPLPIDGGVLTKAEVDGVAALVAPKPEAAAKPKAAPNPKARSKAPGAAQKPIKKLWFLLLKGPGRQRVDLALRYPLTRSGGWQIASGTLPAAPAAALTLEVPRSGVEVLLSGGVDRGSIETKRDGQKIETALGADGAFHAQWRSSTGAAQVDRGLSAKTAAIVNVQEDGLRLQWRCKLDFRGAQRDSFTLIVPAGYLVERVGGANVRGWRLHEVEGQSRVEVTLLKAAQDAEQFSVALSRRGAVGSDALATFSAPVVQVAGAARQSGELAIRRSPLLELRTEKTEGVTRGDNGPAAVDAGGTGTAGADGAAGGDGAESPLGIVPYQTYSFATTPFTIQMSARPVVSREKVAVQTVLKISQRQRTLESRLAVEPRDRPVFRLRVDLPPDWKLDRVVAPEPFQWAPAAQGERRTLDLYFAEGQRRPFDVVLSGGLGDYGAVASVTLPRLQVLAAGAPGASLEQSGEIVVQADPSLNVRAEDLAGCETGLLSQANAWLAPAQQRLARLALRYRGADYSGKIQLSPRKPVVHCQSVTNIRVTQRTVEETILLDFNVQEAGIRSLSFLLPPSMRDARISAPLLRQKAVEPVDNRPESLLRVRLDLQDEVMDNLRVLVENDRLLTAERYSAPIPVIEAAETDRRYVTLESAGRDEVVVERPTGIDQLGPEQAEWRMLSALLGRGLTQAYLVQTGAVQPRLLLHAQDRSAVETAGARIGLAKVSLTVDAAGAYRGEQLYRVDNSLEQYLEVQLPPGARLWTAHVAGEPVKPVATADPLVVRIPLVKTATGDADYPVVLKYAGQLGPPSAVARLEFPLIRTRNIHVELSQAELHLPESFDWFDFDGTMRPVDDQGYLAAGLLSYNTRQMGLAMEALRSKDAFARARAANNLKQLQLECETITRSAETYGANESVAQELRRSQELQRDVLSATVAESTKKIESVQAETGALGNRSRFNDLFQSQMNTQSGELLNQAGDNFIESGGGRQFGRGEQTESGQEAGEKLDSRWLSKNKLEAGNGEPESKASPKPQESAAGKGQVAAPTRRGAAPGSQPQAQPQAPKAFDAAKDKDIGREFVEAQKELKQEQAPLTQDAEQRQLSRYTQRLDRQQQAAEGRSDAQHPAEVANDAIGGATGSNAGGAGMGGFGGQRRAPKPGAAESIDLKKAPRDRAELKDEKASEEYNFYDTGVLRQAPALVSLDVDLERRGKTFYFTTPRGDVEVSARAISDSLVGRLVRLALLALAVFACVAIGRAWRARHSRVALQ